MEIGCFDDGSSHFLVIPAISNQIRGVMESSASFQAENSDGVRQFRMLREEMHVALEIFGQ